MLQFATTPQTDAEAAVGAVYQFFLDLTDSTRLAELAAGIVPAGLRILLVLAVAYVLNRFVRRVIKRSVRRLTHEGGFGPLGSLRHRGPLADTTPMDIGRATMRAETIGSVLRSVSTFLIWSIAVIMVLGEFAINLGPLIAGAGVVGVALGFGAQRLVQDFLSGIFLLLEDQYGLGDIVDTGEATGVIEGITLRITRLRDIHGTVWHVPNGQITRIGNMSQEWARALLDVGVAYDTDLPRAMQVMKRVADDLWRERDWSQLIMEEPEVWGVQALSDNEVTIRMVIKTRPGEQWAVTRELRKRLKGAFDAEGVEIPFPQRVVWMRRDTDGAGYLRDVEGDRSSRVAYEGRVPAGAQEYDITGIERNDDETGG